jgi:valyl-tRNA synthetase
VAPKTPLAFSVRCDAAAADLLAPMQSYFESMANARATAFGPTVTAPAFSANVAISGSAEVYVDLAELIDVPAEIARKKQEVEKLTGFIAAKEKKLTNASFVERAPADVVQKERDSLKDLQDQLAAAQEVLARLEKK